MPKEVKEAQPRFYTATSEMTYDDPANGVLQNLKDRLTDARIESLKEIPTRSDSRFSFDDEDEFKEIEEELSGPRKFSNATPTVTEIGQMHGILHAASANICNAWLFSPYMCNDAGKVNIIACVILGDLLFWYSPIYDRDTQGKTVTQKRFKGDIWQMTYEKWADRLNLSKRQVQDACHFLRDKGVIRIEVRNIIVGNMKLTGVTYFEPIPDMVRIISIP